ncbi:MAG: hypothetical protein IJR49_00195 [Treponema sp.]|nr:hypothetical protein [Treponema sp.]
MNLADLQNNQNISFLNDELRLRYGTVQRARAYFLYTQKGVRLTDMYQEGGRAILGWKGHAFTMFKNVLNRGLSGSFPTDYKRRLKKAISVLLNSEREIFLFENISNLLSFSESKFSCKAEIFLAWHSSSLKQCDNIQNEQNSTQSIRVCTLNMNQKDCIVIVPPFPWACNLFILAVKKQCTENLSNLSIEKEKITKDDNAFCETILPAAMLVGITRSIYDLIAEIPKREEKQWFLYDSVLSKYWKREGAYLYPKIPESSYKEFISHCLDCCLVISPNYFVPSIVPFGVDISSFKKLKNNPFEVQL